MFSALTFNMQNGQVWDEESPDNTESVRLEETIAFLRAHKADVIFLQEVERGHEGGRQIEPPPHFQRLKAALNGYDAVFGYPPPNPLELPFGLGLAIFSKTPLTGSFRVNLPAPDISFEFGGVPRRPSQRLLLGAETKIAGHSLRLLNTHLQAFFMINASSDDYLAQRDLLEAELKKSAAPTLLGGDFNCGPRDSLVRQMTEAGFNAAQNEEITWRRMPFILDHLFYNSPLKLESREVIPTLASDHHAVRATFSFIE